MTWLENPDGLVVTGDRIPQRCVLGSSHGSGKKL